MDVTDDKKIKLDEIKKDALYQTLYQTSVDGMSLNQIFKDSKDLRLLDCNESYVKLSGLDKEQLLQAKDIKEFHQNYVVNNLCNKNIPCETGETSDTICSKVYSWHRPDQKENFIECRGVRIKCHGQNIQHCIHRDVTHTVIAAKKVKALSHRLSLIGEEERKRIARDLHDEFGHLGPSLRKISDQSPQFNHTVLALTEIIRKTIHELRPDLLDNIGLCATIQWMLHDFEEHHPGVNTEFKNFGLKEEPSSDYSIIIYRIFQEAMNNITKYSQAKNISVTLTQSHPGLILMVKDDGIGFDTNILCSANKGIGLKAMSERLLAVDGTLHISSKRGVGTKIRAELILQE